MSTPLQQQFEELRTNNATAELKMLPSGAGLVIVPGVSLPPGWTSSSTDLKFIAPVGYPFAKPDCFFATGNLRLANGNDPQASNMQPLPEIGGEPHRWFSWHVASWNPNRDSLSTYFKVILGRMKEVR